MFSKYRGFSAQWPYISFQGLESEYKYIWLINAYEKSILNRIIFPDPNIIQL